MKRPALFVLLTLLLGGLVSAEKISFINGTIIDPATGFVDPATITIDGNRITGLDKLTAPSAASKIIDCKGKFILPGYIDTHIHFFQSGDIFTRPDAVDLTKVRSYKDEVAWIKKSLPDTFARYLRCGITSVVDVGGPFPADRSRDH
jgi:cytosine/adenosine deaminase-related metal-dependent hydrolase